MGKQKGRTELIKRLCPGWASEFCPTSETLIFLCPWRGAGEGGPMALRWGEWLWKSQQEWEDERVQVLSWVWDPGNSPVQGSGAQLALGRRDGLVRSPGPRVPSSCLPLPLPKSAPQPLVPATPLPTWAFFQTPPVPRVTHSARECNCWSDYLQSLH